MARRKILVVSGEINFVCLSICTFVFCLFVHLYVFFLSVCSFVCLFAFSFVSSVPSLHAEGSFV